MDPISAAAFAIIMSIAITSRAPKVWQRAKSSTGEANRRAQQSAAARAQRARQAGWRDPLWWPYTAGRVVKAGINGGRGFVEGLREEVPRGYREGRAFARFAARSGMKFRETIDAYWVRHRTRKSKDSGSKSNRPDARDSSDDVVVEQCVQCGVYYPEVELNLTRRCVHCAHPVPNSDPKPEDTKPDPSSDSDPSEPDWVEPVDPERVDSGYHKPHHAGEEAGAEEEVQVNGYGNGRRHAYFVDDETAQSIDLPHARVRWAPNFDDYAAGVSGAHQIQCALCSPGPCTCGPIVATAERIHQPAIGAGENHNNGGSVMTAPQINASAGGTGAAEGYADMQADLDAVSETIVAVNAGVSDSLETLKPTVQRITDLIDAIAAQGIGNYVGSPLNDAGEHMDRVGELYTQMLAELEAAEVAAQNAAHEARTRHGMHAESQMAAGGSNEVATSPVFYDQV